MCNFVIYSILFLTVSPYWIEKHLLSTYLYSLNLLFPNTYMILEEHQREYEWMNKLMIFQRYITFKDIEILLFLKT